MIVYEGVDLTELLLIAPVEFIAAILAIRWRVGKKLAARLSARLRPRRLSLFTRILSFLVGILVLLLVSWAFTHTLAYLSGRGGTSGRPICSARCSTSSPPFLPLSWHTPSPFLSSPKTEGRQGKKHRRSPGLFL